MYQMMLGHTTAKKFCLKFGDYGRYIRANYWNTIIDEFINDEVFLKNYVDAKDRADFTLLLKVIWNYDTLSERYNVEEIVKKLIEYGSNVNYIIEGAPNFLKSPFVMAKEKNLEKIIKIFEDYESLSKKNSLKNKL